jgi:hypothetical protein
MASFTAKFTRSRVFNLGSPSPISFFPSQHPRTASPEFVSPSFKVSIIIQLHSVNANNNDPPTSPHGMGVGSGVPARELMPE